VYKLESWQHIFSEHWVANERACHYCLTNIIYYIRRVMPVNAWWQGCCTSWAVPSTRSSTTSCHIASDKRFSRRYVVEVIKTGTQLTPITRRCQQHNGQQLPSGVEGISPPRWCLITISCSSYSRREIRKLTWVLTAGLWKWVVNTGVSKVFQITSKFQFKVLKCIWIKSYIQIWTKICDNLFFSHCKCLALYLKT